MEKPIAIVDKRVPKEAKNSLSKMFIVHEFLSHNSTYTAVSGHPDIFMFQDGDTLILAPNTPNETIDLLKKNNKPFIIGSNKVGTELNNSAYYNCIATSDAFYHKKGFTDSAIIMHTEKKTSIFLPQAYTRCGMFSLNANTFICSDKGIEKALIKAEKSVLYTRPDSIHLPPYKHGFIGGCLGMFGNTLYILGSLSFLENHNEIKYLLKTCKLEYVELYSGRLFDGGGIFFIS